MLILLSAAAAISLLYLLRRGKSLLRALPNSNDDFGLDFPPEQLATPGALATGAAAVALPHAAAVLGQPEFSTPSSQST